MSDSLDYKFKLPFKHVGGRRLNAEELLISLGEAQGHFTSRYLRELIQKYKIYPWEYGVTPDQVVGFENELSIAEKKLVDKKTLRIRESTFFYNGKKSESRESH